MDGRTLGQRENSIPSHKHSLRGGGGGGIIIMRKTVFVYEKMKIQISCGANTQLISMFVFDTAMVQSVYVLKLKF